MSLMTYTRAAIWAEVRNQLREPNLTGAITDTNLEDWTNRAVLDLSVRTKCIRTDATGNSISGQQANTIVTSCVGAKTITRVEFNGVMLEGPVPFNEVDQKLKGKALTGQGTPRYWVPYGRTIRFYPVPGTASHNKLMHMFCATMSEAMAASGTTLASLGIPELYGPAIETFVRHKGLLKLGREREALDAWKLYQLQTAEMFEQRIPDVNSAATAGAG